jgi:hypothetical protein
VRGGHILLGQRAGSSLAILVSSNFQSYKGVVYVAAQSPDHVRISKNWRKMSEIYRKFGGEHPGLDYSEEAAKEMYLYETRGEGNLAFGLFGKETENGYAVGKKWMNVHIEMWKKDIQQGILFRFELEEHYPKWFLDKFVNFQQGWPLPKWAMDKHESQ